MGDDSKTMHERQTKWYTPIAAVGFLALLTLQGVARGQNDRSGEAGLSALSFENSFFRFIIGADGRSLCFIDKSTGTDYYAADVPAPFARINISGQDHHVSSVVRNGNLIELRFGDVDARANLKVTMHDRYLVLEVVSLDGEEVDAFTFIDVPLRLTLAPDESVAACALALNLRTNVLEIPKANNRLRAMCYAKFGFVGAKVALICCPKNQLREVMKEIVSNAAELPQTRLGGPWALDAEQNRGSYLIDVDGQLSEQSVDEWIQLASKLGINQINLHCGRSFRFGDYRPNPTFYPRGLLSVKNVVDKLHQAGILAGLHTYSFFIAKDAPWVTPVPDSRLAVEASFTLADDLSSDAKTVGVIEPTTNVSSITGFHVRNSQTLRIDDELIVFHNVAKKAPFAFTECQRGAHGTRVESHAKGAKVDRLKECFGLFAPEPDSTLFTEIVERTAEVYNTCGFDMIYLDALDGSDVLAGKDHTWHYGSKFVFDLAKRLDRPAIFEMSTFHHHLWYVRSRMGAWDVPARGGKRTVDMHCIANEACRDMFLPAQLGWWGAFPWSGLQPERTFPDDIEYLCSRCIADDCGLSLLTGFTPEDYEKSANTRRLAAIIKNYEDLRRGDYFSDEIKQKLRIRGDEFTLEQRSDGHWQFRPVHYDAHRTTSLDKQSLSWTANNRFAAQPIRLRIEALLSAGPYEAAENIALANFTTPDEFAERKSKADVTAMLEYVSDRRQPGERNIRFSAISQRSEANTAWTMVGKQFSPYLNLNEKGIGVWIHGDGKGEVLNFQTKSPAHLGGGIFERYVTIDFQGWRYIELIEPESDRILDYQWPYCGRKSDWDNKDQSIMRDAFTVFIPWVDYANVQSLNLWYNNLPVGQKVECSLSPPKALPLIKNKIVNPIVSIGDATITFPVELESGSYLEFISSSECRVYNAAGEIVGQVIPEGSIPLLQPGPNRVTFSCQSASGLSARAVVTLISSGSPL